MKTKIVSYAFLAMLFIACEKENTIEPSVQNENTKKIAQNDKVNNAGGSDDCGKFNYRKFEIHGTRGVCTCIRLGTCMADVVINGLGVANGINAVFDEIGSGNQSAIQSSFNTNQDLLDDYINIDLINGVISGELEVYSTENTQESKKFMLFANDKSNLQTNDYYKVIPFDL